jgi:hypothetical protein
MTSLALVLLVLAVGFSAIVQICTDARITCSFISKSLLALAVYALRTAVAVLVLVYVLPWRPEGAFGAAIAAGSPC